MRPATAVACAALLAAVPLHEATAILRCESADGRVTYSNTECPPATTPVRRIEPTPPVIVHQSAPPAAAKPAAAAQPATAPLPATGTPAARRDDPAPAGAQARRAAQPNAASMAPPPGAAPAAPLGAAAALSPGASPATPASTAEDGSADDPDLRAQLAEQRRECEARADEVRRLRAARDDAAPAGRATAEAALRGAEADFRALCPRPR